MLIEKDGKFELVDPDEVKAEYYDMLGLPVSDEKQPSKKGGSVGKNTKKSPNRPSRVSTSNAAYLHVQSEYGMSEQQKEMKKKRISIVHMRKQEEKERLRQEEEEKRIVAEKSFRVKFLILIF